MQRDPESTGTGWWYELDEDKILAKTAQALREGAPQIKRALGTTSSDAHTPRKQRTMPAKRPARSSAAEDEYQYSHDAEHDMESPQPTTILSTTLPPAAMETPSSMMALPIHPTKLVRMDYNGTIVRPNDETPPLLPTRSEPLLMPPLSLPAAPRSGGLPRSHSLAFSDISDNDFLNDAFVNPFDNEMDKLASLGTIGSLSSLDMKHESPLTKPAAQFIGNETTSLSSLGDLGGLGTLLHRHEEKTIESTGNDGGGGGGVDEHHSIGVRLSIGDAELSRYDACQL